jgi:hypothetical protein
MRQVREECAMNVVALFGVAAIACACCGPVLAADAATDAATAASASNGVTGHAKKDAMSVKNDRLHKCKGMEGDEKKACQRDAQADAKRVMKHEAPTK